MLAADARLIGSDVCYSEFPQFAYYMRGKVQSPVHRKYIGDSGN